MSAHANRAKYHHLFPHFLQHNPQLKHLQYPCQDANQAPLILRGRTYSLNKLTAPLRSQRGRRGHSMPGVQLKVCLVDEDIVKQAADEHCIPKDENALLNLSRSFLKMGKSQILLKMGYLLSELRTWFHADWDSWHEYC